jgi:hypothetical protein
MIKGRRGAFVGIARNCAPHLGAVLKNLAQLSSLYDEATFVFVVSDSSDDTVSMLARWISAGRAGRVIDLGNLEKDLPRRTERLAFARNAYLDELRRSKADYDHLIVVDLDDVLVPPVSAADFEKALKWLDAVPAKAAVFANARPRYYDLWALRHPFWLPHDCWQRVHFREAGEQTVELEIREVYGKMIKIRRSDRPVRVLSAFGGIAVYRLGLALKGRYVGIDALDRETCEHVAFNQSVREAGGQLYIYPPLMVEAPTEHSYEARRFPRKKKPLLWVARLKTQLRWWLFLARTGETP